MTSGHCVSAVTAAIRIAAAAEAVASQGYTVAG